MKICLAQIHSIKGDVWANIQLHLHFIERAIELKADLIIFPELSITGYEPTLAKELATTVHDPVFDPFQELADKNQLTIGVGMPLKANDGIEISLFIFQENQQRKSYSKQLLHEDELTYFVAGNRQTYLEMNNTKIALGICYETLQCEHILDAKNNRADIYIASVTKSQTGIEKAYLHFPKMANELKMPILMSNAIGHSDDFFSAGQSAVWNEKGELLNQLDVENQGLLVYDTISDLCEIHLI